MKKKSLFSLIKQQKKQHLHSLMFLIIIFSLSNYQCQTRFWGNDQWIQERTNIGGGVQSINTQVLRKGTNNINPNQFTNHLRYQNLPQSAISSFIPLQYIEIGSRSNVFFTLNQQQTSVQSIGVAVHRFSQNQMKVSLIWRKSTSKYFPPQTYFRIGKRRWRFFIRKTSYRDHYEARGLNDNQRNHIKNVLNQQIAKYNVGQQAIQQL